MFVIVTRFPNDSIPFLSSLHTSIAFLRFSSSVSSSFFILSAESYELRRKWGRLRQRLHVMQDSVNSSQDTTLYRTVLTR